MSKFIKKNFSGGTNAGFTLIELLVVVLIIGILASVALPQYQKAVRKSQMTQVLIYTKALADAQDAYYMANGRYSTRMDELDIAFPACSHRTLDDGGPASDKCYFKFSAVEGAYKLYAGGVQTGLFFAGGDGVKRIHCYRGGLNGSEVTYFSQHTGVMTCSVPEAYADGRALIESMGGKLVKTHNFAGSCNKAPCLEFAM